MDKEKQIEEMARIFGSCQIFPDCTTCDEKCGRKGCYNRDRAKVLYNANYRKINENEVVISKEEYERLQVELKSLKYTDMFKEAYISQLKDELKQASKETAREIYRNLIELSENPCNDREEIYKAVFEPYGVEIGEEK